MHYLILLCLFFISACGGGGSDKSITIKPASNQAPIIDVPTSYSGQSGSLLTIEHSVIDPENDPITLVWSKNEAPISITHSTLNKTSFQLPDVSYEQEFSLTLTATDSKSANTYQDITIRILPKSEQTNIDLAQNYTGIENTYLEINALIDSAYTISEINWQLDQQLMGDLFKKNNLNGNTAESQLRILLPFVNQTTTFNGIISVESGGKITQKPVNITVKPQNSEFLTITVPNSYSVNEGELGEVTVNINSSDEQPEISWRWQAHSTVLNNDKSTTVSFTTPEVDTDQNHILEVTVSAANQTLIKTIPVTFKDVVEYSEISLKANRTLAVKGHDVFIDIITDNPQQISNVQWHVDNLSSDAYHTENHQISLTIPAVNTGLYIDIKIEAIVTLQDNSQTTLSEQIRVFSEEALIGEMDLQLETDKLIKVYNGEKKLFDIAMTGSYELIDSVSIDMPFTLINFDVKQATLNNNLINIELLSYLITQEKDMTLSLTAYIGDYKIYKYFKFRALSSHFSIYPGYTESFFSGTTVKIFSQLYHDGVLVEHNLNWDVKTGSGEIHNIAPLEAEFISSSYHYGDVILASSYATQGSSTTTDMSLNMFRVYENSNEDIYCSLKYNKLYCTYDDQIIDFEVETNKPKQIKLSDNAVCIVTQSDTLSCKGDVANPIVYDIIQPHSAIARLNLVGNENACIQYENGQWQCWGTDANFNQSLIEKFTRAYKIIKHKENTCVVGDGFLHCYDADKNEIFKDRDGTVRNIQINYNSLCYDYTHASNAAASICPEELK